MKAKGEYSPCFYAKLYPCVGCGYCCNQARCAVSFEAEDKHYKDPFEALGEPKKCPYLFFSEGRYWCHIADKYKTALAIGEGCCSSLNSTRKAYVGKHKEQK